MSDEPSEPRLWTLIQFKPQGRPPSIKSIDIVPTSWLLWSDKTKKCRVLFPPPPYNTDKTKKKIHNMIKNLDEPEDDWPTYAVELKGSDDNHSAGLEKVERLRRESHVFTLEEGENASDKEQEGITQIKKKNLNSQSASMKAHLSKLKPGTSVHQASVQTVGTEDSSSDLLIDVNREKYKRKKRDIDDQPVSSGHDDSSDEETKKQSSLNIKRRRHLLLRNQDVKKDKPPGISSNIDKQSQSKNASINKCIGSTINVSDDLEKFDKLDDPTLNEPLKVCRKPTLQVHESTNHYQLPVRNRKPSEKKKNYHDEVPDKYSKIISELVYEVKEMKEMISRLLAQGLTEKKNIITKELFSKKHQLKIPITDIEQFHELNDLLKANDLLKHEFCEVLKQYLDQKNHCISQSIVTILKSTISKEIATKFVAQRESPEVIIEDRVAAKLTTTENEIMSKLGIVLSNASKWGLTKKKPNKKCFKPILEGSKTEKSTEECHVISDSN